MPTTEAHPGIGHPIPVVAVDGGNSRSGTLATPKGPITWTQSSDGTIHAEGGGQKLTVTGNTKTDGSWRSRAVYARASGTAYLTMDSVGEAAEHNVALTFSAGSYQLTLTVADIDARVTFGSATLSGVWNGAAVRWTGHADLTSNPLVNRPIAGWPPGAFSTELRDAAFFAPLGKALSRTRVAPPTSGGTPHGAGSGTHHAYSAVGVFGRAGAWCLGGAYAASGSAPETLGGAMLLGCAAGAGASLLGDLITWIDDDSSSGPIVDPPVIDLPPDPEPTGPETQTQPDDPPPPPSGGGGDYGGGEPGGGAGGGKPDDDKPPHEQD